MEKEHIAKLILQEKEFLISNKVTIFGKREEVYENSIYNGKSIIILEFLNLYEINRDEVVKYSITEDEEDLKISRNAFAIVIKDR